MTTEQVKQKSVHSSSHATIASPFEKNNVTFYVECQVVCTDWKMTGKGNY